ncbi:hypothetical protein N7462_008720 [Penicillium macrosclerotiorum]|uniref:uncharacterized protein n=1 Tax=Penicillium macrosclerotiorum TaxID=303699 RepID=UPI0025483C97|nr:uncharacterized protein N7462_008720 [Penicillium macrosclerotiorum]KAJ5675823.1 hypothetical protein N7462_008720 [Penicillium macrosclerotiorum]
MLTALVVLRQHSLPLFPTNLDPLTLTFYLAILLLTTTFEACVAFLIIICIIAFINYTYKIINGRDIFVTMETSLEGRGRTRALAAVVGIAKFFSFSSDEEKAYLQQKRFLVAETERLRRREEEVTGALAGSVAGWEREDLEGERREIPGKRRELDAKMRELDFSMPEGPWMREYEREGREEEAVKTKL